MSIMLYAPFGPGHDSFAHVGRQFVKFLRQRHFYGTVYATKTANPDYRDLAWPVGLETGAHVGIYVGYPPEAPGWLAGHNHKILVTVCETKPIPYPWVAICNRMSLVVVPSRFCKDVFEDAGVKTPIVVCRHGIEPAYLEACHVVNVSGGTRILHVTHPSSFPQRKATSQLLIAMSRFADEYLWLYIKTPDAARMTNACKEAGLKRFAVIDKPIADMRHLYWSVDAVCQPSRAEGFGLVPLEARAAGAVPIITTVSGHAEHFTPAIDYPIPTGAPRRITTQANEFGHAPTVTADGIVLALTAFLRRDRAAMSARLRDWREKEGPKWLWSETLKPLLPYLKEATKHDRPARPGAFLRGIE